MTTIRYFVAIIVVNFCTIHLTPIPTQLSSTHCAHSCTRFFFAPSIFDVEYLSYEAE